VHILHSARTCPACGAGETTEGVEIRDWAYRPADRFHLVRCARCGLRFLDPQPSPEELADYYPPDYGAHQAVRAARPQRTGGPGRSANGCGLSQSAEQSARTIPLRQRLARRLFETFYAPGTREEREHSVRSEGGCRHPFRSAGVPWDTTPRTPDGRLSALTTNRTMERHQNGASVRTMERHQNGASVRTMERHQNGAFVRTMERHQSGAFVRTVGRWVLRPLLWSAYVRANVLSFPPRLPDGRPRTLLDVGCGSGRFLARMRDLGWTVCGVEPDPEAAERARGLGLTVHTGTLSQAGFPSAAFDVVTLWEVIEHLPNPVEALVEVARVLRPDGLLVLSTPNVESLAARWFGAYWFNADVPRHVALYTPQALRRLLERAGFSTHRLDYLSSTSGWLGSIEYWLRYRRHVDLEGDRLRKHRWLQRLALPWVRVLDWMHLGDGMRAYAAPTPPGAPSGGAGA